MITISSDDEEEQGTCEGVDDVVMTHIKTRRIADIFVKRSTKRPRDEGRSAELPDCVTHLPQFLPREVAATAFDTAEPLTASWPREVISVFNRFVTAPRQSRLFVAPELLG